MSTTTEGYCECGKVTWLRPPNYDPEEQGNYICSDCQTMIEWDL